VKERVLQVSLLLNLFGIIITGPNARPMATSISRHNGMNIK